jgi:hypothetical protein
MYRLFPNKMVAVRSRTFLELLLASPRLTLDAGGGIVRLFRLVFKILLYAVFHKKKSTAVVSWHLSPVLE